MDINNVYPYLLSVFFQAFRWLYFPVPLWFSGWSLWVVSVNGLGMEDVRHYCAKAPKSRGMRMPYTLFLYCGDPEAFCCDGSATGWKACFLSLPGGLSRTTAGFLGVGNKCVKPLRFQSSLISQYDLPWPGVVGKLFLQRAGYFRFYKSYGLWHNYQYFSIVAESSHR